MDEIVSIGEFSQHSGLSPKRLRSYAAAGLLRPVAVDPGSGYRYYRLSQLRAARLIDALRAAGMPISGIGDLLDDPSPARLDAWSRHVQIDAEQRQQALDAARSLLIDEASIAGPSYTRPPGGPQMLSLRVAARSEVGRARDNNEDSIFGGQTMVVVADGMGGHNGGEIASQLAVSLLKAAYAGRSVHELEAGVRAASRAIWDRAVGSPDLQGMGTTICAAGVTADNELGVVHVGDSRAYLWRDGGLQRLTRDHSVTSELLASGELTESQVADHPLRGYITRALGVAPDVEVSSGSLPAAAGDRLMVCSDGLWGAVPDDEIEQLMAASEDIESTADGLVKLAQARGSEDDVSVVVADVYAPA